MDLSANVAYRQLKSVVVCQTAAAAERTTSVVFSKFFVSKRVWRDQGG